LILSIDKIILAIAFDILAIANIFVPIIETNNAKAMDYAKKANHRIL
jgi:hypothetical protein